jgi:hypothetical protein
VRYGRCRQQFCLSFDGSRSHTATLPKEHESDRSDRAIFQASPDELPVIDIHSL